MYRARGSKGRTSRKSKCSSRGKDECTDARKGKCVRDLCNDHKLTRYNGRTMQLSSLIKYMTEKNDLMFEEDRKINGDCKFYVAEICGMESLTYGARIYQHIDT